MSGDGVQVERLEVYDFDAAAGIGRLMPYLSDRLDDHPIAEETLRAIIESPWHEQLIARLDGRIVGAATLSVVMNAGAGPNSHLGDFIVDPTVRGQGIGDALWNEVITWCRERKADLEFTSHPSRTDAYRFYLKHGAELRDTGVFHVDVNQRPK